LSDERILEIIKKQEDRIYNLNNLMDRLLTIAEKQDLEIDKLKGFVIKQGLINVKIGLIAMGKKVRGKL